jgi:CheY-like chemotaxis protein
MAETAMKPLSILVVDDVPEIQQLLATWLKPRGYRVAAASTGSEAVRLLQGERFDLVIADVLMPDGDGLDLIRDIKIAKSGARVLAISGGGKYMPAPDCVKLAATMGADAVLLKPFDEQQLLKAMQDVLAGSK